MFVKPQQRAQARQLRTDRGMAIRAIAEQLGVSKSSVSLWVRDIALTPEQEAALAAQNPALNGQMLGMRVRRERCRSRRVEAQEHGRALAARRDPAHRGGCMLYWAEGSKRRNAVELVNADANLLRTQRWWLARLELPVTCLRQAVVNRPSSASKGRKGHVLPHGTARIVVHSTDVIQSIYGAIQEYAGIERPEWLDL